jgi:hypothetical protein
MKWEYMTLLVGTTGIFLGGKLDGEAFNNKLNEAGAEGWELVAVTDTNKGSGETRDIVAVFKRPVK